MKTPKKVKKMNAGGSAMMAARPVNPQAAAPAVQAARRASGMSAKEAFPRIHEAATQKAAAAGIVPGQGAGIRPRPGVVPMKKGGKTK